MPRPQIIREYFAVFVGFSVFLTKGRERVIRSEKKFCETPAVQRSCYLFFGEFLKELAGSTFVTIIFATNFMIFFSTGVCWWCEFFVFLFCTTTT